MSKIFYFLLLIAVPFCSYFITLQFCDDLVPFFAHHPKEYAYYFLGKPFFFWWIACAILTVCIWVFVYFTFLYKEPRKTLHGSAVWATRADIKELLKKDAKGNAIGTFEGYNLKISTHLLACAPTRSGKGVGCIIPACLSHPGSLIIFDPKGESYSITARRRAELGSKVCLIDPFNVTGSKKRASFNFLDTIDTDKKDCISKVSVLVDAITVGAEHGNHFDDSAKDMLELLILYVCAIRNSDTRNLKTVRELLLYSAADFERIVQDMVKCNAAFGVISGRASQYLAAMEQGAGKEQASILSTARRFTKFLDDPQITDVIMQSSFDLNNIKIDNISIFLVLPVDKIDLYKPIIRIFFSQALSAVMNTQVKPVYGDILFIFDEFTQLGHMAQVENGISFVRGFGAVFWIFVQDLSQLKGIYKKWQGFLANATRLFFGCCDVDTAKYISETLGKETLENVSITKEIETRGSVGRLLLTPDEVMKLQPTTLIAFISATPPVKFERITYFKNKSFLGMYDNNPFI